MRIKQIIAFLIIFSLIYTVSAGTQEQVTNGAFTSSLTGWTTGGDGYAGSTHTSTWVSSGGQSGGYASLYANGGSSTSGWANTYITQSVDLTNTNTLYYYYKKINGDYGGASVHFKVYIDTTQKLDYTGSFATSWTQLNVDVSGYSGFHDVKFYVSESNGGTTNKYLTIGVDTVTATATTTAPTVNSVNGTPLGGTVSFDSTLSVDKTDGYPTDNTFTWTILPASGWSYKTGNANSESPEITITDAGEYQATCVVANDAGSDSASVNLTATAVGYNVLVNVLDAENSTALTHQNCTVYLWQGDSVIATQYTGTTGNTTFTSVAPDTYTIWASATGYTDNYVFSSVSGNTEVDVTLSPTSSSSTGGVSYSPHNVKFTVLNTWGAPVEGAQIVALSTESSSPLSWLEDWLGISSNIDINGTTLSGTTGYDGTVSFMMIESVKYDLTVSQGGATLETLSVYPEDDQYYIYVSTSSWWSDGGNVNEDINISVSGIEDTNVTNQAFINITYADASLSTTKALIHLNQTDATDPTGSEINLQSTTKNGLTSFSQSYIIHDYAGESYIVRLNITSSDYGYILKEFSVYFEGALVDIGIPTALLPWVAILFMLFIGGIFTASSATNGMIVVCFFGWAFWLFGWFGDLGGGILGALSIATVVSVIAIIMKNHRKEGYR